jgi:dTDP-4-dehydrorhamnose reductase
VNRRRVLVTGAAGQLGSAILSVFDDHEVIAHTRATLDVTSPAATAQAVAAAAPSVIVNCAAFNDVDGAEDRPLEALAINAFAVRSLARAAEKAGATFIHYSTDFVFDGTATAPYDEATPPAPLSTYGASKLLGEWFALDAPGGFVLRVESLFGTPQGWTGRRGTLDAMLDGLQNGREIPVFTDRIVSPAYIVDIAAATRHLVENGAAAGIYHCVNSGAGSWHDVAVEAARQLGVEPRLRPLTMGAVTMKARRPQYCALSNRKLTEAGFAMPDWQDALRRWLWARGLRAA